MFKNLRPVFHSPKEICNSSQTSAWSPTSHPLPFCGRSLWLGTQGEGFESTQTFHLCISLTSLEEDGQRFVVVRGQVDNVFGVSTAGRVYTVQRQILGVPVLSEWPAGLLSLNTLSEESQKRNKHTHTILANFCSGRAESAGVSGANGLNASPVFCIWASVRSLGVKLSIFFILEPLVFGELQAHSKCSNMSTCY